MISQLKNVYHFFLAWLGDVVYRHPSRELTVIGVTGTKGKTSTVELLGETLAAAGHKVAWLSGVHVVVGNERELNATGNTMPGRLFIQRWLRRAVAAGCQYAIFEVTSQGAVQYRHRFIDFDVAAITCLHAEHIESHGSFEAYRNAKVQFFRDVAHYSAKPRKHFFINKNLGPDGQFFEQAVLHPVGAGKFGEVVFYGHEDFVRNILGGDKTTLSPWLQATFNTDNAALAYAVCRSLGVSSGNILETFADFSGVVGRMERFTTQTTTSNGAFTVVVDYAHTPGSFKVFFEELQEWRSRGGRVIAVFGSYGEGRDQWKRPEIGRIAAAKADYTILTNEGPGAEDPLSILKAIEAGMPPQTPHQIIPDRREAIRAAMQMARAGDIVALIGKGHETYINLGAKKLPWNERAVAEEVLRELQ